MDHVFEGHGIRFEYPDNWTLHEQASPEEITLTVHASDTSFWSLTLILDRPDPQRVLDSVLKAFREEYSEIDVYSRDLRINDQPSSSCELDFVCHELIGKAFLSAIESPDFTLLVLSQGSDLELGELQPQLEKITGSLTWETDVEDDLGDLPWKDLV